MSIKQKLEGAVPEKFYISQKVVLYDKETQKFLLMKDGREDGEFFKKFGPWELVGGRVDRDEDFETALFREVSEEADLASEDVEIVGVIDARLSPEPYGDVAGADVTFLAYYLGGEIKVSAEHSEFKWETAENIEKDPLYKEWLKLRIKKAREKIQSLGYINDLKRTQADFENYKKRQVIQQKELGGYLIEKLLLDIIPVLDNFRQATMHVPPEQKDSPWVIGIQYIEKQLEDAIKTNGVEVIEVKEGDAFDPQIHEAIGPELVERAVDSEPSSAEATDGQDKTKDAEAHTVTKVLQKGFKVGDRVVRPAKVVTR